jgi:hypothetical protein
MHRPTLVFGLLLAIAWPATGSAQYVSSARGPIWDRFSLEPYAGRYYDNVETAGAGFHDSGWLGGLRLGLAATDRFRLLGDIGYAQVDGIATAGGPQDHTTFGSQTWLVTGGIELDVVPGDTRGALSLLGGAAWRELRGQATVGDGAPAGVPEVDSPVSVLVPGFAVIQRIAPRADLKLSLQDYIFIGADPVSHNWALTAAITLR